MELLLDTDKCFKTICCKYINRAGLSRLFLLILIVLFSPSLFGQSIPWSLKSEFVCYINSPLDWNNGFQNIENIQHFTIEKELNKRNNDFLQSISKDYNCHFSILEKLFHSKIIIISSATDLEIFDEIEQYLFDIEKIYMMLIQALNNGILIIENYQGLEELIEIISTFDVQFLQQGDYLVASKSTVVFSEYQLNMVNRNEFSKDILFYAETKEKNLTLTNAFSFLNIEIKTLTPESEMPQFPVQIIEIPLEYQNPESLLVFANYKVREFFYKHFEVISSIEEWQVIFELIDQLCVYGFYYELNNQWLIGFKSENMFYENKSFETQISKWGISKTEMIKPYANSYYLSVVNDYFMISNFKPQKVLDDDNDFSQNSILLDLVEKIGKKEVFEVGYEYIEEFGFPCYFFSSFDDKIKKQVVRFF